MHDATMDDRISGVLSSYHRMIQADGLAPPLPGFAEGEQDRSLRPVGPEVGRLVNILARSLERPVILELGTSYGYSGIWLAEAARASGGRLITMERDAYKADFARTMATEAGLAEVVDFRVGDAVAMIGDLQETVDFVLLDLWKDLYVPCLEAFFPKLAPGALVVADNMIWPETEGARLYGQAIRTKPGVSTVRLPVGQGIDLSRLEPGSPRAG